MNFSKFLIVPLMAIFLFGAVPGFAADVSELERRIDMLSDELDQVKSSGGSGSGLLHRTSVHGYGEMHVSFDESDPTHIDQHRFVIGVHSELTDWIHLNAEIDFEHAAQELEFEMGYLDFLVDNRYNFRTGVMLMPMGNLNENHEPNLFWTVERPEFHTKIIPLTWQQGGAGVFGTITEGLNYRVYVVNALQSIGDGTSGQAGYFRGSDGLRKGRQQLNKASAADWAITGRLEYTKISGLNLGFSFYNGDSTHGFIKEDGNVTMLEGDMKYRRGWFDMNASIANIDIDDSDALNTFCAGAARGGGSCRDDIPENIFGYMVQAGVHVPQLLGWKTSHDLIPFVTYEKIRPIDEFGGEAKTANRSKNFDLVTTGISYMPTKKVALKIDYQQYMFQTGSTKNNQKLNLGVAYMY